MAIAIREAVTEEERFACYRLRYETYVEEMQRQQEFADHEQRITKEPYDDYARLLIAEDDGVPVGTMRMSMRRDGPLECEELYRLDLFSPYVPDEIGMITKFVIRTDYRRRGVAGRMALAAYEFGRQNGIRICIIDAYPHLVQLYLQMGYRFYMHNIRHPDYGSVIPMVLILEDIEYFRAIRSPFHRLARRYENSPEPSAFFQENFPEYASVRPLFALDADELFSRYSEEMAFHPEQKHIDFLEGFTKEDVQALLSQLALVSYEPGEFVFRQDDQSLGMFCIMHGQVEVIHRRKGKERTVAILNQGDIFGEMGFVAQTQRTASIRVREQTELLVLSPNDLDKLTQVTPALGTRFLTNLFRIVVERYINVLNQDSERK